MDASEIYSKRLNAKEVIFPKQGESMFPIADGRIKTPGGDQDLRTSTLIRPRPIQGEGNIDFLGESEGSLPQPQDSFPDAGEAINDFWSMSGNFIYRHHVEPRVKLYSPREESLPIPLKYIDVSRTTHTNLDVKQEKRIDDYWNIDGSRDLSDSWTGFTRFTLLEEKPPDGYMWSWERSTRKRKTSFLSWFRLVKFFLCIFINFTDTNETGESFFIIFFILTFFTYSRRNSGSRKGRCT